MFGFKKKEKKPLFIKARDVFSIIKSDYDKGFAFCLIEFRLEGAIYTMGSEAAPDCEEKKENIRFFFEGKQYDTYEDFAEKAEIHGMKLSDSDIVIEIVRAGIFHGEALIKTPWGDTRLARMALQR